MSSEGLRKYDPRKLLPVNRGKKLIDAGPLQGLAEHFVGIDPRIERAATRVMGPTIANNLLVIIGGEVGSIAKRASDEHIPDIQPLAEEFLTKTDELKGVDTLSSPSTIPAILAYGTGFALRGGVFFQQLTELLLQDSARGDFKRAQQYSQALIELLDPSGTKKPSKKINSLADLLDLLILTGPTPAEILHQSFEGADYLIGKDELMRLLVLSMGIDAATLVKGRQELATAEKNARRNIAQAVDRPAKTIQTVGKRLIPLEGQLEHAVQQLRETEALIRGGAGSTAERMAAALAYAAAVKSVADLQMKVGKLEMQMNTAENLELGGGAFAAVQATTLDATRQSMRALTRNIVFKNVFLQQTIADTFTALVQASAEHDEGVRRRVIQERTEAMRTLPSRIKEELDKE